MDKRDVMTPLQSLEGGLDPLRAWFEREASHVRILVIQSAT